MYKWGLLIILKTNEKATLVLSKSFHNEIVNQKLFSSDNFFYRFYQIYYFFIDSFWGKLPIIWKKKSKSVTNLVWSNLLEIPDREKGGIERKGNFINYFNVPWDLWLNWVQRHDRPPTLPTLYSQLEWRHTSNGCGWTGLLNPNHPTNNKSCVIKRTHNLKSRCVCETLCPGGNKVQKAILASRSKSRSHSHWPWCHIKGRH